jgi:hypothetical protein
MDMFKDFLKQPFCDQHLGNAVYCIVIWVAIGLLRSAGFVLYRRYEPVGVVAVCIIACMVWPDCIVIEFVL